MKKQKNSIFPNFYEKDAWKQNFLVCGIDEVGRGCLAGPLVVSAVILPLNCSRKLKDSKKLNEKQKNEDFEWITQNCIFSTAIANPRLIDNQNIYQTTLLAMKKAALYILENLPQQSAKNVKYLLVDAMPLKLDFPIKSPFLECHHFNYGETLSSSIAAASIVAKVTRDRMMEKAHQIFPQYGFNEHKGYGTGQHLEALKKFGTTVIHRKSFLKNINFKQDDNKQQSLF